MLTVRSYGPDRSSTVATYGGDVLSLSVTSTWPRARKPPRCTCRRFAVVSAGTSNSKPLPVPEK